MSEIRWVASSPVRGAMVPASVVGPMAREVGGPAPVQAVLEPVPPPPPPPPPIDINVAVLAESQSLASRMGDLLQQLQRSLRAVGEPPPQAPAASEPTPEDPAPAAPKRGRRWSGKVRLWAV